MEEWEVGGVADRRGERKRSCVCVTPGSLDEKARFGIPLSPKEDIRH